MTEQVVRSWINNHGVRLHEMRTNNPKYSHLINQEDHIETLKSDLSRFFNVK